LGLLIKVLIDPADNIDRQIIKGRKTQWQYILQVYQTRARSTKANDRKKTMQQVVQRRNKVQFQVAAR
jgi:hypothetical protein